MRVAFDTNVVAYAEGFDDLDRGAVASQLVARMPGHEFVLPVQVCAELAHLVVKKFRRDHRDAAAIVRRWQNVCSIQPASTANTFATALDLAAQHRLQIFDAVILCAAYEADSYVLLSEDMQDGFVWRGVTVVNPFALTPHPMLVDLMRG